MGRPLSILLIGEQSKAKLLRSLIKKSTYHGSRVFSIPSISNVKKQHFDLIITSLHEGVSTLPLLFEMYPKAPILYMGNNEKLAEEAIRRGAQDYLIESELTPELLTRIFRYSIAREGIKKRLEEHSFTDDLTGVYNRRGLFTLAKQQMELTKRTNQGFLLFLFDLDFLKQINDSQGHQSGDAALIDLAKCLTSAFRSHDLIGRLGGDEFVVLALNSTAEAEAALKQHVFSLLKKSSLSCSMGTTYYSGEDIDLQTLLERADRALYKHKKQRHASLLGREERI